MRDPSPKTRSTSFAIKFVICFLLLQGLSQCISKFWVARKLRPLEEHLLWQAELRHNLYQNAAPSQSKSISNEPVFALLWP